MKNMYAFLDAPTGIMGPNVEKECSMTILSECRNTLVGVCIRCSSSDVAGCRVGDYQYAAHN